MKALLLSLFLLPLVGKAQTLGPSTNKWAWSTTLPTLQTKVPKDWKPYPLREPSVGQPYWVASYDVTQGKQGITYYYFFSDKGLARIDVACEKSFIPQGKALIEKKLTRINNSQLADSQALASVGTLSDGMVVYSILPK